MAVVVWTERRSSGPWDQCSECSYLMGLIHGGYTSFRLGAYTAAERDSFTMAEIGRAESRAANKPMFPLLDDASLRRYGVRLRRIRGGSYDDVRRALSTPGNCVMLPGWYRGLVWSHPLRAAARHWNGRDYTGGHMVAAIVQPDRKILWLDPLAPNKYGGMMTDLASALAFAWIPSDAHEVMFRELVKTPDTSTPKPEEEDPVIHGLWPEWATPTVNNETGVSNGVLRAEPLRSAPIVKRVEIGEKIMSVGEVRTAIFQRPFDNGDWRVTPGPDGKPLYMLRADWQLLGRDEALFEAFRHFVETGSSVDVAAIREWHRSIPL